MKKNERHYIKTIPLRVLKVLHYLICIGLFVLCGFLFYRGLYPAGEEFRALLVNSVAYIVLFYLMLRTYNGYYVGYDRIVDLVYSQGLAQFITALIIYAGNCIIRLRFLNPLGLLALVVAEIVLDVLWCYASNKLYFAINKPKRTVIIYRNENDLARLSEIKSYDKKFTVEKYIEDPADDYESLYRELDGFEAVFVVGVNATLRNAIVKYCTDTGVHGYFAPHVGDIVMAGAPHVQAFGVPIVSVRRARLDPEYYIIKRCFDIFASLLGIIISSPFMLVVALCIKLYDGGPVLYKQTRLTKNAKQFRIWKFRSMRVDAEKDGIARLAKDHDDRITPVGKIIRACRLDELPQLFNILSGDMSIVGPRPERPEIAAQYEEIMPAFSLRLQVKAGLTGYAQIYGKYNTAPYDKLQMDLMYINNMSPIEDLKLMFATIRILFMKESTSGVDANQVIALRPQEKTEAETEKEPLNV